MDTDQRILGFGGFSDHQHTVHRHRRNEHREEMLASALTQGVGERLDLAELGTADGRVPLDRRLFGTDSEWKRDRAEQIERQALRRRLGAGIQPAALGVDPDQLWFEQSGNDLKVSTIGGSDYFTVLNWYDGTGNRLDFETSDGSALAASDVQNLVSAMAAFAAPPAFGTDEITGTPYESLTPTIAANWSS